MTRTKQSKIPEMGNQHKSWAQITEILETSIIVTNCSTGPFMIQGAQDSHGGRGGD